MPDEREAAEAFGTLSDPTRIAILRAFAAAMDDRPVPGDGGLPVLSFSELYDRVDVDSTSRLSYHLDELDGRYLRHTDDGWRFTFAGESIVRLFLSGAYAGDIEFEPVGVPGQCVFCEAEAFRAKVDDLLLFRECGECGRRMGGVPVTPAQVRERDAESLLESASTRMASALWEGREGVCVRCGGTVAVELRDQEEFEGLELSFAVGRCRQCWQVVNSPLSHWLATHPASVAFHWDHGVDVTSFGLDELTERLVDGAWDSERVAPGEYRVTYRVEDAELRLTIDDDLSVTATERVRRDSVADR